MNKIFKNKNSELRNVWKILLCIVIYNIMSVVSVIIAGLIFQNIHISNFSDMISKTMNSNLGYALAIVIMSVLFFLFYKYIIKKEKITWSDLGVIKQHKLSAVLKGFALGIAAIAGYIFILIVMKQVVFEFNPLTLDRLYSLFMGLIIFSGVAFAEEVTFRGYFQYLLSKNNKYVGVILSSMVFALNHLFNFTNYTVLSLIYLMIAGILFSIIRMTTNNIWFPIGFHVAWNWTEIRVFGLGSSSDYHWLSTKITQDTIWNGGESGSGLVVILTELILIVIFACWYYVKNKKKAID